ncbi:hypothetical protein BURPS1710b_2627 [Burkholderia pseudomallei 1710b]|uniref:Uncharacterized protein n=1 Tax=Burkholderia pseudomallei (strain 1710b) TaxID=320372 RepID=Q3JQY9_BURP1|nr:hypothetical protein BURPS1710b_2627 [Burkholderia pseudomallei 1710b]
MTAEQQRSEIVETVLRFVNTLFAVRAKFLEAVHSTRALPRFVASTARLPGRPARLCERRREARHDDVAAEQQQHRVDRRRMRRARDEQAHRHRKLRHLQLVRAEHGLQRGRDRLLRPLGRLQRRGKLGERRAHRVGHVLRERLRIRGGRTVEHRRILRDLLHRRRAILHQPHHAHKVRAPRDRVGVDAERREERLCQLGQARVVRFLDVVVVQPVQLVVIVLRGRLAEMLEIEPFDELLAREDLRVAVRPAETREIVEHRLRQIAGIAVAHHAHRAVALAHLLALLVEHGRQMRVHRHFAAERAQDVDLARRIVHMVVPADHVRDAHVEIVDDDAEVVRRRAVGARDDEIVELLVRDLDAALHGVVPDDRPRQRIAKAQHGGHARRRLGQHLARLGAPRAIVARLLARRALALAQRIEFFGRHVARVDEVFLEHLREHLAIAVHPLHLVVRAFVVVEPEPCHPFEDRIDRRLGRALEIRILDPQHERALHLAGERPRIERGSDVAEMDEAGGARRKTGAYRTGHKR